ncbi:MAG TPA: hypothetical protein VK824_06205 [Planctomycetota bacterium]|nr:hypothetical protein [Planctomycetota bacterium]
MTLTHGATASVPSHAAADAASAPAPSARAHAGAPDAGAPEAADADGLDTLAELRRLETSAPARSERRARPAGDGPVAFVPRTIAHSVTATVVVREEPDGAVLSQETFRISPEAVSVTDAAGCEWWLARNPVHPDELSGARCDPAQRLVLQHGAGDLRLIGGEDLWDRIAELGNHGALTEGLVATGRTESAFGLEFAQWVAEDDSPAVRELLWNEQQGWALRSRATVGGRSMLREIAALEWSVDGEALRDPLERHPGWLRSEISDLEDMREAGTAAR